MAAQYNGFDYILPIYRIKPCEKIEHFERAGIY